MVVDGGASPRSRLLGKGANFAGWQVGAGIREGMHYGTTMVALPPAVVPFPRLAPLGPSTRPATRDGLILGGVGFFGA